MRLSLTTWNINSVRLRIDLVARFIKSVRPDILCLQETKCIDDAFPLKRFKRLGYEHIALNGQNLGGGENGVVDIIGRSGLVLAPGLEEVAGLLGPEGHDRA